MKLKPLSLILTLLVTTHNTLAQQNTTMSIYDIEINTLDGSKIDLNQFKDKYILFVNVASQCGFTNQYEDLQNLYNKYQEKLMVIGVPCNQFGAQEPGSSSEIQTFCQRNYGVTFMMTEKIDVKGKNQHPLYQWLTNKEFNGVKNTSVKWNFQKYIIGPNGQYIDYFYSMTKPLSSKITRLIV